MRAKKQETKNFQYPLHYKRLLGAESPASDQSQQPWGSYGDCGLNSSLVLRLFGFLLHTVLSELIKKKKKKNFQHVMNAIALFFLFPQRERWKKNANFIIINGTCVCRGLRLPYLEGTCDGVGICCPQRPPAPVGLTYNDEHVPQGPGSSSYQLWKGQEESLAPGSTLQVTSDPQEEQTYLNSASRWSGNPDFCRKQLRMEGESLTFKCPLLGRGNFWNSAWKSRALDSFNMPHSSDLSKCSLHVLDLGGFTATQDLLIVVSLALTLSLVLCMYSPATALG